MNTLPDIPRIYTAIAEWMACILYISGARLRMEKRQTIAVSVAFLMFLSAFLFLTDDLASIAWILCMLAAFLTMFGLIMTCAKVPWRDGVYLCAQAFVLAEFAASLEWQIDCYLFHEKAQTNGLEHILLLIAVYAAVYGVMYRLYSKRQTSSLLITNREMLSCLIIALAIFSMSNMGFVSTDTIFGGHYAEEIFNVRTLVDLGGVAILYAFNVERIDQRTRSELESVENILQNQYIQYKQSREAMDVINFKYHDLKHQIYALRAEENDQKRNEYLDRMEEELADYETHTHTGHQVLDVLISAKTLYCRKHGISLTTVVDGKLFDFIDTMDLCTLFGNALDNAIECELKIPDKEKRLIHVSACAKRQFLILKFENYVEEPIVIGEKLPLTTKGDERFHGFGLKSLKYTAAKYDGEVNVRSEGNWFDLTILIPLKS